MTKCMWDHCMRDATCVPEICVPATGGTKDHALRVIVDLTLCEDHLSLTNMDELLFKGGSTGQVLANVFVAAAKGAQGPPPDFTRAWMIRVPITSMKYKAYAKQREKFQSAQRAAGLFI